MRIIRLRGTMANFVRDGMIGRGAEARVVRHCGEMIKVVSAKVHSTKALLLARLRSHRRLVALSLLLVHQDLVVASLVFGHSQDEVVSS